MSDSNSGWLISDRLLRIPISLVVGVFLVRSLGPELAGVWNITLTYAALFSVLSGLAQEPVIVQRLASTPERTPELLGTSLVLKLAGAMLALPLAVFSFSFFRTGNDLMTELVLIFSLVTVLQSFSVVDYYFQSRLTSHLQVMGRSSSFLVFSAVKLLLLAVKAPIIFLAWTNLFEVMVGTIFLLLVCRGQGQSVFQWKFDRQLALDLVKISAPLFFASLAILIYTRLDLLMLGALVGEDSAGIYAAAVRLSEAWLFIPSALAASALPVLVSLRSKESFKAEAVLQHLLRRCAQIGWLAALMITLFAGPLVQILYGSAFSPAVPVLVVQAWSGLFIALGIASVPFFTLENLQWFTLYRTLAGVAINLGLNVVLIPRHGVLGAAIATVITQAVASYLFNSVNKQTRKLFQYQTKALFFPFFPSRDLPSE